MLCRTQRLPYGLWVKYPVRVPLLDSELDQAIAIHIDKLRHDTCITDLEDAWHDIRLLSEDP